MELGIDYNIEIDVTNNPDIPNCLYRTYKSWLYNVSILKGVGSHCEYFSYPNENHINGETRIKVFFDVEFKKI